MDDKEYKKRLLELHFNIMSHLESDKISNETTELLVFIDKGILDRIKDQVVDLGDLK